MNYPVWELSAYGGGLLIALIATIHVYISHFAVGGGLFLVITEIKARREDDKDVLAYVHSHTKFFLLLVYLAHSFEFSIFTSTVEPLLYSNVPLNFFSNSGFTAFCSRN